jgi:hypothetical protein
MANKMIYRDRISSLITSSIHDSSYDLEIWYDKNELLFVYHIDDSGNIQLRFGALEKFYVDIEFFQELTNEAVARLRKEQSDWLDSLKKI